MIFVRALWGDASVCTHDKALFDVQNRLGVLPPECAMVVVAYGQHNAEFISNLGYRCLARHDLIPREYDALNPSRPKPLSRRRPGTVVSGITMWWHKLDAIRSVMYACDTDEVIWLDWDTRVLKQPDEELFALLANGPPLQSAECPWKTPRAPWRTGANRKWSFHGGCYYVRGIEIIQKAIDLHAAGWCLYTDETVMTWIADHDLAGQPCENNRLYRCRKTKPNTDVSQAYFMEGDVFHWKDERHA